MKTNLTTISYFRIALKQYKTFAVEANRELISRKEMNSDFQNITVSEYLKLSIENN